jgi:putative transposase
VKYAFISDQRNQHTVSLLCRVLGASCSGYWNWCRRGCSRRAAADRVLLAHIEVVHEQHHGHCGAVKTWRVLNGDNIPCGKHQVARIRRQHDIVAKRRRRFVVTTKSKGNHWRAPNLLSREFHQASPNKVWVGDVTYVASRDGHLYVAVLIDLFSRTVVGWSTSKHNDVPLIMAALNMAIENRNPAPGLIHHSDQGRPYAATVYRQRLMSMGARQSMSRKGNCWDNAVAESFFATLEFELLENRVMESREVARDKIADFIEVFYNRQRSHQTLDYKTPLEMENVA